MTVSSKIIAFIISFAQIMILMVLEHFFNIDRMGVLVCMALFIANDSDIRLSRIEDKIKDFTKNKSDRLYKYWDDFKDKE